MKHITYFFYLFFVILIFTACGRKYDVAEYRRPLPESRPASSVPASNFPDYNGGLVVIESGLRLTIIHIDVKGEVDAIVKTKTGRRVSEEKGMRNGGTIKLRNLKRQEYELKLKVKKTDCKRIIFKPSNNPRTQKFPIEYDY